MRFGNAGPSSSTALKQKSFINSSCFNTTITLYQRERCLEVQCHLHCNLRQGIISLRHKTFKEYKTFLRGFVHIYDEPDSQLWFLTIHLTTSYQTFAGYGNRILHIKKRLLSTENYFWKTAERTSKILKVKKLGNLRKNGSSTNNSINNGK